jgi:NAD+ kinase
VEPAVVKTATTAPHVLVIFKKSAFQLYVRERRSARVVSLLRKKDVTVQRLRAAHDDHVGSIAEAKSVLLALGTRAVFRYRADIGAAHEFDLVVTLGGDGTLLWASHAVGANIPVVAINTAPQDSVGFFCAGTKPELGDVLADAVRGRTRAVRLTRMRVDVDGERLGNRVLNDALFCHECPAATSRYLIARAGVEEEQKSSGLWVGPAAGSTAAQRSAGGRVLAVSSQHLQYVVREPYTPGAVRYKFERGLIAPDDSLHVINKMRSGRLYLDGPHAAHVVQMGARLTFARSDEPLTLLGLRRR